MSSRDENSTSLGFKKLALENWTEPDPTNLSFGRVSRLVGPQPMRQDDWARAFLAVELKEHVPASIRELFAIARGAMLYGWFFYPLFRLGEDQVHRVTEAAARACYRTMDGPKGRPSFRESIDFLISRGVIPEDDRTRWEAARKLRNAASHPDSPSVMPPGAVLKMLNVAAHDINRLFARSQTRRRS